MREEAASSTPAVLYYLVPRQGKKWLREEEGSRPCCGPGLTVVSHSSASSWQDQQRPLDASFLSDFFV